MKIVFMGTTSFGTPSLDALAGAGHEIRGIVSTPGRKKGRGLKTIDSEIVLHARKMGYGPVMTPQTLGSEGLVQELKGLGADLFIVVAFRILPHKIFSIPGLGTYNIHASLLPRYRGPAPIQRAIAAGETETGVTVFRIDDGIDTGTIVLQKKTPIKADETSPQLSERLSQLAASAIVEAVSLISGPGATFMTQDPLLACPAPKLVKSEGKIEWDLPAHVLFNTVRAFVPFPGSYTFLKGERLVIEKAVLLDTDGIGEEPATVLAVAEEGFDVQCGRGALRVLRVRPEGKKSMSGRDFANGRSLQKGMKFA